MGTDSVGIAAGSNLKKHTPHGSGLREKPGTQGTFGQVARGFCPGMFSPQSAAIIENYLEFPETDFTHDPSGVVSIHVSKNERSSLLKTMK
jgi:hypothetical protein